MNKSKKLNSNILRKVVLIGLSIGNIAFIGYVFTIGYYNTILVDDFYFLAKLKDYGFFGSIGWWYNNWQGRIMPYLLINAVLVLYQIFDSILPLTIFLLSLYILSVYRILINLGLLIKNKLLVINLIILSFAQILFTSFEPSTFYWVNVSTMYYGGMIFLLLGISEVLSVSKMPLSYIIITFSFFYVGCSSEHIGVLTSAIMVCIMTYSYVINKEFIKKINLIKMTIATICCCLGFIIMFFAPGNDVRISNFPKISIVESLPIAVNSYFKLIKEIIKRIPYFITLGIPFILLGYFTENFKETRKLFYFFKKLTCAIVILLFIAMIPTAYATSSIGPWRALIYVNFIITSYIVFSSYLLGTSKIISSRKVLVGSIAGVFVYVVILFNQYINNLPSTINFAKAHRKQIIFLNQKQTVHNKENIYLPPIYGNKGNVLREEQLSPNPNYWLNQHIMEGLQLDFDIIGIDK